MKQHQLVQICAAVAAVFAISSAAAADSPSRTDMKAGKERIEAAYKSERAACDSMNANAKDICVAEAKGHQKVARAELEYGHSSKAKDMKKLAKAKADADYDVAKERCDDKAGNDKDVCVKEAKAQRVTATANATASQKSAEAKADARADKMDAQYNVAVEKCDAMAGDAKSRCMAAAKTRFHKKS